MSHKMPLYTRRLRAKFKRLQKTIRQMDNREMKEISYLMHQRPAKSQQRRELA